MKPYDPNSTKPTAWVGGAGHYNKRGAKSHKGKDKK